MNSSHGQTVVDPASGRVLHRPLDEEVLQSAEEAVIDEAVAGGVAPDGHAMNFYSSSAPQRAGDTVAGDNTFAEEKMRFFARMESQLTRFVAVAPAKAALLAVGAGALLTLALSRRRDRGGSRR